MKLAAISMIRDEADIIAPFVRHLAALFDIVFLLDQRSSDGTGDTLRQVCRGRENWFCYLCDFAGRHQKEVNAIFMRKAFEQGADAVFFIDSDEFVGVASKAALEDKACLLSESQAIGVFHLRACVPAAFDGWPFNPLAPLWIAVEDSSTQKIAISRTLFLSMPEIHVSQGNHSVIVAEGKKEPVHVQMGHYFHIPVRSRQQFVQKVFVSAIANLAKNNPMISEGVHKRRLLEIIADCDLSDEVLASISGKYAKLRVLAQGTELKDLPQQEFVRRALDVPLSDIPLPLFPRPELSRIMARCLRDFELEKLQDGEGSLHIEHDVVRFKAHDGPKSQE
jgi:hypothetical protein